MAAFSAAGTLAWTSEPGLKRSLLATREALSSLVQVLKQGFQLDLVNTCRIADTHESRHQVEETAPHIRAAPGKEYVSRRGTMPDDLGDFHITGYPIHQLAAVTITSGFDRTRSAASEGTRSILPSAQRNSSATLRPSTQPYSARPVRNASRARLCVFDEPPNRPPMRRNLSCVCTNGDATNVQAATRNCRRRMCLIIALSSMRTGSLAGVCPNRLDCPYRVAKCSSCPAPCDRTRMALNEMWAVRGMPQGVRLSEGLAVKAPHFGTASRRDE